MGDIVFPMQHIFLKFVNAISSWTCMIFQSWYLSKCELHLMTCWFLILYYFIYYFLLSSFLPFSVFATTSWDRYLDLRFSPLLCIWINCKSSLADSRNFYCCFWSLYLWKYKLKVWSPDQHYQHHWKFARNTNYGPNGRIWIRNFRDEA